MTITGKRVVGFILGLALTGLVSILGFPEIFAVTLAQAPPLDSIEFIIPDESSPEPVRQKGSSASCPCMVCLAPIIGLVPPTGLGWTISEYPTFFITLSSVEGEDRQRRQREERSPVEMYLFLLDEEEKEVAFLKYSSYQPFGTFAITLPETVTGLEVGKFYHWFIDVFCSIDEFSPNLYVEGWIKRIEVTPVVQAAIAFGSPEEKLAIYAREGIWHETLDILAQLSGAEPENPQLLQAWQTVLATAQLEAIANEPLISRDLIQFHPEN